jgi:hypothetical protein
MPLFRRRHEPDPLLAELSAQVAHLQARLDELDVAAAARATTRSWQPPSVPTAPPLPPLPPPDVDSLTAPLRHALDELATRLTAVEQARTDDRERVDARLAELTTTVTDQLHELSGGLESQEARLAAFRAELEALAADTDEDERFDDLLDRQTRIANEVARHEIAFQQELAALADRLTRQRPPR